MTARFQCKIRHSNLINFKFYSQPESKWLTVSRLLDLLKRLPKGVWRNHFYCIVPVELINCLRLWKDGVILFTTDLQGHPKPMDAHLCIQCLAHQHYVIIYFGSEWSAESWSVDQRFTRHTCIYLCPVFYAASVCTYHISTLNIFYWFMKQRLLYKSLYSILLAIKLLAK